MKEYIEVDREPIVGDVVKIVYSDSPCGRNGELDYHIGDYLKLIKCNDDLKAIHGVYATYQYGEASGQFLYRSEFVVVEEKVFSKKDLKPFMLVRTADDVLSLVAECKSGLCLVDKDGDFIKLSSYSENLVYTGCNYDIIEVYGFAEDFENAMKFSIESRAILFEKYPNKKEIENKEAEIETLKQQIEELEMSIYELKIGGK